MTQWPQDRSADRDIFIATESEPDDILGGLILTDRVSNANFYFMVEIFVICEKSWLLRLNDADVPRDNNPLLPGKYLVRTDGSISINDDVPLVRAISLETGTRINAFRNAIRERDRRCIITGKRALRADANIWTGFQASHIFPLAYEQHWLQFNHSRWITDPQPFPSIETSGAINSIQNGLILRTDIHQLWDAYMISINPDDNYKVVCFVPDGEGIGGKSLRDDFVGRSDMPVDQLLRWHFRQAVLANMKGVGVPIFKHDFPPGSDVMGEIAAGPLPAERMEFELLSRFNSLSGK